jgi:hypothetical protein
MTCGFSHSAVTFRQVAAQRAWWIVGRTWGGNADNPCLSGRRARSATDMHQRPLRHRWDG